MINWTYIPFSIGLFVCLILLIKIFKEDDAGSALFDLIALLFCFVFTLFWGIFFIW